VDNAGQQEYDSAAFKKKRADVRLNTSE